MVSSRLAWMMAFVTGTTLVLQLMILYRNDCQLTNNRRQRWILKSPILQSERQVMRTLVTSQTSPNTTQVPVTLPVTIGKKRRLTIAIPTIKRRDGSYFLDMFASMLNKTSKADLEDIVFVIFLADIENDEWKLRIEAEIQTNYFEYIASGSLKVIQAPVSFYSSMLVPKNNSYLYWRTKQNYDYAYLMKQSQHLSDLYMQMEDDVIATSGYYGAINEYIDKMENPYWVCLEFSELGFIGKLYHSKHVNALADMLLMFSETQPVDYTFLYFNILMGQGYRYIRKPTLFQHMGYHSSLAEKVQPLKDKYFNFPLKELFGDNPSAKLFTTFLVNPDFPPELAYSKEPGFFWSNGAAKTNDTFTIVFDSPQKIRSVIILTGTKDHSGDFVHQGVLEASASVITRDDRSECEEPIVLAPFQNGGANLTSLDITQKMGMVKMKCLRLRVTSFQNEWVIIKEIAVYVQK